MKILSRNIMNKKMILHTRHDEKIGCKIVNMEYNWILLDNGCLVNLDHIECIEPCKEEEKVADEANEKQEPNKENTSKDANTKDDKTDEDETLLNLNSKTENA